MSYPLVEPAPSPAPEDSAGALAVGYRCPDCDKVFPTSQGLGAHRARVHGYKSDRKRPAKRAQDRPQTSTGIDARKVLRAAFPNGIPATPEAVAVANQLLTAIQ